MPGTLNMEQPVHCRIAMSRSLFAPNVNVGAAFCSPYVLVILEPPDTTPLLDELQPTPAYHH